MDESESHPDQRLPTTSAANPALCQNSSCIQTTPAGPVLKDKPLVLHFEHMYKQFKCQECGQFPSSGAYICVDSHVYCHYCYLANPNCRRCQKDLERNPWIEQVINKYSLKCPYQSCGEVYKMSEINFHTYTCKFMTSECFETFLDQNGHLKQCCEVVLSKDFNEHLREHHGYK